MKTIKKTKQTLSIPNFIMGEISCTASKKTQYKQNNTINYAKQQYRKLGIILPFFGIMNTTGIKSPCISQYCISFINLIIIKIQAQVY